MDFGKYIYQLIQENEVVIIPGFGAFISEYKPAEINDDSDEIKPPSRIISFNSQIRNNDGLLVGFVAEQKRVSHFDALKKIEKERENILYKLDGGEEFEIDEVGVLYSTDKGIQFRPSSEESISLDSFGLEAASIAVEEPKEEPAQDVASVDENLKETHHEENISLESEEEIPEQEAVEESVTEETKEEQKKEEPEKEEAVHVAAPIVAEEPQEEKKKKRAWWWLLLILVPLIGISVYAFLTGYWDGNTDKQNDSQTQIKESKQAVTKMDSAKEDTLVLQEQDTTPVIDSAMVNEPTEEKQENVVESNKPQFYLVGGSFKEQENAETYLQELKAKGFSPFHLGKYGSFFVVGIGTYPTEDEAKKAKAEYLTKNPGSGVWILER